MKKKIFLSLLITLLIAEASLLSYNQYIFHKKNELIKQTLISITQTDNKTGVNLKQIRKDYNQLKIISFTFNRSKADLEYQNSPVSEADSLVHSDLQNWCVDASGLLVDLLADGIVNEQVQAFTVIIGYTCQGVRAY